MNSELNNGKYFSANYADVIENRVEGSKN